ncbi:hypothetical protein U27_05058 [Candidatus Vecturithrix granuli]|uniref:Uncharacterized protein n=1 Tax=Vecturithrix granuli TaxID=1499967 RepID=A0A081C0I0_VECG1|nr:hypothetical protein U27_05058 [Candidatus Vecturithrix granuli]
MVALGLKIRRVCPPLPSPRSAAARGGGTRGGEEGTRFLSQGWLAPWATRFRPVGA